MKFEARITVFVHVYTHRVSYYAQVLPRDMNKMFRDNARMYSSEVAC